MPSRVYPNSNVWLCSLLDVWHDASLENKSVSQYVEDTNDTYIMELLGGLMTATNRKCSPQYLKSSQQIFDNVYLLLLYYYY